MAKRSSAPSRSPAPPARPAPPASANDKTQLPDARVSPRFAGVATFGRYPLLAHLPRDKRAVDWAIYGAPFDAGVTYRPGARFGPRAVREESQYLKRYSIEHDLDICTSLSLADAGDAPVNIYDCQKNTAAQFEFASGLGDPRSTRLLAIGGDHSIALANIKATFVRAGSPRGGLALAHFDSHLDTVDAVWGEKYGHASVFRRAIEEGLVNPKKMLSIGLKGPLNTSSDLEFARAQGVKVLTYAAWASETGCGSRPSATVAKFVREVGDEAAYITFDIDCVDPAFAPGTGTPSVGGFTSAQALALVRALKGLNVRGADVVEVLPDRDVSGITALLAAHVAFEVLCLSAAHAKA